MYKQSYRQLVPNREISNIEIPEALAADRGGRGRGRCIGQGGGSAPGLASNLLIQSLKDSDPYNSPPHPFTPHTQTHTRAYVPHISVARSAYAHTQKFVLDPIMMQLSEFESHEHLKVLCVFCFLLLFPLFLLLHKDICIIISDIHV